MDRIMEIVHLTVTVLAVAVLFGTACDLVHVHRRRNRVLWWLNRVRAATCFGPDPGPWENRR